MLLPNGDVYIYICIYTYVCVCMCACLHLYIIRISFGVCWQWILFSNYFCPHFFFPTDAALIWFIFVFEYTQHGSVSTGAYNWCCSRIDFFTLSFLQQMLFSNGSFSHPFFLDYTRTRIWTTDSRTHTSKYEHIYIYKYICICLCGFVRFCACGRERESLNI